MARKKEIILEDNEERQKRAAITNTGQLAVTTYMKDEVGCLTRINGIMLNLDQFKKLNDFYYASL
jgi:hypothetical protein